MKDRYAKWILENADAVAQMESMLRAALLLVPGRFRDSELSAEAGTHSHFNYFELYRMIVKNNTQYIFPSIFIRLTHSD